MKFKKVALITGITGQDGSILADYLLKKKYKIIGIKRRSSSFNTERNTGIYCKRRCSWNVKIIRSYKNFKT